MFVVYVYPFLVIKSSLHSLLTALFQPLDLKSLPWYLNTYCIDPSLLQEEMSPCFFSCQKRKLFECYEAAGAQKRRFSARPEPILLPWVRLIPQIVPGNKSCEVLESTLEPPWCIWSPVSFWVNVTGKRYSLVGLFQLSPPDWWAASISSLI